MTDSDEITVPKIEVFPERLRLHVQLGDAVPRFTNEVMIAKAYEAYPTLPVHSCINAKGPTFGDVAVGTSVPHLLEHLIIAEQVRIINDSTPTNEATFVGTTSWSEDGTEAGKAIVEVSFLDDLQALKALRNALALVNEIVR